MARNLIFNKRYTGEKYNSFVDGEKYEKFHKHRYFIDNEWESRLVLFWKRLKRTWFFFRNGFA